ncbi:MAG: T9SS type A sorting domain-containing protein, partial [Flavobacteriales bacterium]
SFLDTVLMDPSADTDGAYAFVDDVCISDEFGTCDIGAGITETLGTKGAVSVHDQGDRLIIHIADAKFLPVELNIMDPAGRVRSKTRMLFNDGSIDITALPTGFYILTATTPIGRMRRVSFVHLSQ